MPEPAVFIVVAILAAACAAAPFVYWHIKSRRRRSGLSDSPTSPAFDPTDRIGPIMRRLEAGGPFAPELPKALGAPGMVGLPYRPAGIGGEIGARAGAERVVLPSRQAGSGSSSVLSGTTYVPSAGPSSARASTSTSTRAPGSPPTSFSSAAGPSAAAGAAAGAVYRTPPQTAPAHAHPRPMGSPHAGPQRAHASAASEAPPAYEEVVPLVETPAEGDGGARPG